MISLDERIAWLGPQVVEEMRAVVGDAPAGLFAWMRYHLGWEDAEGRPAESPGGKMLRPIGLLLATELAGGAADEALPAAAAVELVHNFSLLHDDVEDESARRRGRATLWALAGSAQAINTGDGMYTLARLAMHRLPERGFEQRRVIEAMRELDEACLRLVEGQYLDLLFESHEFVTRDEYVAMASGKTAAMFAAPFAIGGLLGGADGARVAALRDFGMHVGLAFQAIDDVLGIWGDPALTGKPAGDDLRMRKKSFPIVAALEGERAGAAELARAYAQPLEDGDDLAALAALVDGLGGRSAAEAFAAEHERAAAAVLEGAGFDDEALAACAEYAAAATQRSM